MKLLLTCHTEYDLKNRFGRAENLPAPKQTFLHLPMLRDLVQKTGIRVTWALTVGGACEDRLIRFVSEERDKWEQTGELAIHFHSERFENGRWVFDGFLRPKEYEGYWRAFRKNLDHDPRSVVFGKWKIDESSLRGLRTRGIHHDGTALFPEKMTTSPFLQAGMVRVPLSMAFDGKPLNPFTQVSHWLYLNRVVKRFHERNSLLHAGIHSYDLFGFDGRRPRLKGLKLLVWRNLLAMIKRYDMEMLTLSEVEPDGYEEVDHSRPGVLSRCFNRLKH
jgi:hypothetical protein